MDQQQRDRLDQDNPASKETDITRSQQRQGVTNDNVNHVNRGTASQDTGPRPSDSTRDNEFSSGTTSQTSAGDAGNETGRHEEGMYPKQDQGGATGGQMAREDQGGAKQGQVGLPGDAPE